MATSSVDSFDRSSTSDIIIEKDDPSNPDVTALLNDHFNALDASSRASGEKGYVLGLVALKKPEITLYTARSKSGHLMGCAALKEISHLHGEIKSMRTSPSHLRKGVAAALVHRVLDVARNRGYKRVSLETGTRDEFAPARALYGRSGFVSCAPFQGYENASPETSLFMTYHLL